MAIDVKRILDKLDEYLSRNDYLSAERHLNYWLLEAQNEKNDGVQIPVLNELIGLYRKTGKEEQSINSAKAALTLIEKLGIDKSVSAATTYINAATAYKAFSRAEEGFYLFEKALKIYEENLKHDDSRLGGLYNNMALSLCDLKRFDEAKEFYNKALCVMKSSPRGNIEMAITYLNMASLTEAEMGLLDGCEKIEGYILKAKELLEKSSDDTDGYYAFVCEKCASTFGYFGHFYYEKELLERARKIYERA